MTFDVSRYKDLVEKCSHCGFCMENCPVHQEDLLQTHSPRGRMEIIRACLLEGSLSASDRVKEVVDRCLLCSNCTQTCATEIPVDEIIVAARCQLFRGKRKNVAERLLLHSMMNRRGIGGLLGKAESVARRTGLKPHDLPTPAERPFVSQFSGTLAAETGERARVAYYAGCATNTLYPGTGVDVVRVLTRNGIEVVVPDGLVCCGMPALVDGDMDTVRDMIRRNVSILAELQVDAIVTDCTSCGMMLRSKSAKVFDEEDPLHAVIRGVAEKSFEVTDYLNEVGLVSAPSYLDLSYTYHVPCHRGWSATVREAPRRLLGKIPGAQLVEMDGPEDCCGAGGMFFVEHRDLCENVRARKLDAIRRTGAGTLITQCPACRSYMETPLKGRAVMHPVSLLARAYGFEPPRM